MHIMVNKENNWICDIERYGPNDTYVHNGKQGEQLNTWPSVPAMPTSANWV